MFSVAENNYSSVKKRTVNLTMVAINDENFKQIIDGLDFNKI